MLASMSHGEYCNKQPGSFAFDCRAAGRSEFYLDGVYNEATASLVTT